MYASNLTFLSWSSDNLLAKEDLTNLESFWTSILLKKSSYIEEIDEGAVAFKILRSSASPVNCDLDFCFIY